MTPRAEVLAIGSELLDPGRSDTNGAYLALRLGEIGIPVRFRTVVGDVIGDLEEAFRVALSRSDLVVATGGLGPTVDDLTREALASLLDLPLEEDRAVLRQIEERFRRLGLDMPPRNRRQAQVPRGAEVLANRLGTAPGLFLRSAGRIVALLPGVPSEMERMAEEELLPRLRPTGERFVYRIFKIAGLAESEVDRRLEDVARRAGEVAWTILASPGQVEIHLRERVRPGEPAVGIERIDREIEATLGIDLFARDGDTLEGTVGRLLLEREESVAVAESLTGGQIAGRISSVPGASRYFVGGVVCYSDEAKRRLLGVRRETLEIHGAASPEVALEMARGARELLAATWGISATGFAGPGGGSADRPPGTVVIGLAGPERALHRELRLPGDRETVRARAAQWALDLLRRELTGARPAGPR
jgi:nicotinamide-nucleotide amidase